MCIPLPPAVGSHCCNTMTANLPPCYTDIGDMPNVDIFCCSVGADNRSRCKEHYNYISWPWLLLPAFKGGRKNCFSLISNFYRLYWYGTVQQSSTVEFDTGGSDDASLLRDNGYAKLLSLIQTNQCQLQRRSTEHPRQYCSGRKLLYSTSHRQSS